MLIYITYASITTTVQSKCSLPNSISCQGSSVKLSEGSCLIILLSKLTLVVWTKKIKPSALFFTVFEKPVLSELHGTQIGRVLKK